jgi:hypothetical protein
MEDIMAKQSIIVNPETISANLLAPVKKGEAPHSFALTASEGGTLTANPDAKDEGHPYVHTFTAKKKGAKGDSEMSFSQVSALLERDKKLKDSDRSTMRVNLFKNGKVEANGYSFVKTDSGTYTVVARPVAAAGTEETKSVKIDVIAFLDLISKEERAANRTPRS